MTPNSSAIAVSVSPGCTTYSFGAGGGSGVGVGAVVNWGLGVGAGAGVASATGVGGTTSNWGVAVGTADCSSSVWVAAWAVAPVESGYQRPRVANVAAMTTATAEKTTTRARPCSLPSRLL